MERGASLISPKVFAAKDNIPDLPWEVRMGDWFIRRRTEGEAKEVESAFLKLTSTAREAFRRLLSPDASLRKLIRGRHCDQCPDPS